MPYASPKMIFRLPPETRAWLAAKAADSGRSMNAELLAIVAEAMRTDPLTIYVHEVRVLGMPVTYAVSIGKYGNDFHEGPSRADAVAAAVAKAKALGLPRDALKFNVVADRNEENA